MFSQTEKEKENITQYERKYLWTFHRIFRKLFVIFGKL